MVAQWSSGGQVVIFLIVHQIKKQSLWFSSFIKTKARTCIKSASDQIEQQIFSQVQRNQTETTGWNDYWLTITCCESSVEEHITAHRPLLRLNMQFLTQLGLHLSPLLPRSFALSAGRHQTVHAWQHLMVEAIFSFVNSRSVYNLDSGFTFTLIFNHFLPKW